MPGVAVVGAGAVGTWLAVRISRAVDQQVFLLTRAARAASLRESGVHVELLPGVDPDAKGGLLRPGEGLRIVSDPREIPSGGLVFFAVRAYQTLQAARMIASAGIEPRGVVTLQNGLGNAEALCVFFDAARVAVGTMSHGLTASPPAGVVHTGRGETVLGPWTPDDGSVVDEAVRVLERGGIAVDVVADPRPALWRKVAVNAAINPPTAIHGVQNGALLDSGPLEGDLREAAREVARVARAEGIDLQDDEAEEAAVHVARLTARNRSSMLQARMAGRPLETDAITGEVVARAERHGIPVPVNARHRERLQRLATGASPA